MCEERFGMGHGSYWIRLNGCVTSEIALLSILYYAHLPPDHPEEFFLHHISSLPIRLPSPST